jgi:hypothetical protein
LAYWGVFRIGELLPARKVKFDKLSDLLWKDVHFSKRGLSITIKSPKVVGREAETVYLHRLKEKWICPVRALKKLKNKVGGASKLEVPVFQLRPGINLTRKVFLGSVNRLLEGSKFQGKEIQGKSFRSGIPSEVELFPEGFRERHLKVLGRWAGVSCRIYERFASKEKRKVFRKVSKKLLESFLRRKRRAERKTKDQPTAGQQQFGI